MNDLTEQVIYNTKQIKSMQNQRRSTIVRKYGEEHTANFSGDTAVFYLPVDTDMEYISELKIKLVLGDIGSSGSSFGGQSLSWGYSTNKYLTFSSWVSAYPVGAGVDVDKNFGYQCYDYGWAFWASQVNRDIKTSNGSASGIWDKRAENAGTEFTLVTNPSDIKKGDWVIWGSSNSNVYGHVALAAEDYNSSGFNCYGQNQGGTNMPGGGQAINIAKLGVSGIRGAFRFKNWTV